MEVVSGRAADVKQCSNESSATGRHVCIQQMLDTNQDGRKTGASSYYACREAKRCLSISLSHLIWKWRYLARIDSDLVRGRFVVIQRQRPSYRSIRHGIFPVRPHWVRRRAVHHIEDIWPERIAT